MKRTTGKDFINEIIGVVNPKEEKEPKILNLLNLLGSQRPYSLGAQPTANTNWPPKPEPSMENIAASINQEPEMPLRKKYSGGVK